VFPRTQQSSSVPSSIFSEDSLPTPDHSSLSVDASGHVSVSEAAIRRVLRSFCFACPHVGYCQGLNFVAANLLRWMGEEEAFWTLLQIVEVFQPPEYYTNMVCVRACLGVCV
jgi:hypothetical protein